MWIAKYFLSQNEKIIYGDIMIGKALKYMRKKNNLKQDHIAKILKVKSNTVSQYETNNRQPTFDIIEKIAKECGFSIYFIDNKDGEKFTLKDLKRKDI